MEKILGLDLGSASIGWAMIAKQENNGQFQNKILGMGSRIIPYQGTEGKDFDHGTGESRNSLRTTARTARKLYDRYQLRRKYLSDILVENNMFPSEELMNLPRIELWQLRAKAVSSPVSLEELGRLMLWLNQKRGYKSSRSDANADKKDTEYVKAVKNPHQKIKELGLTIGQYFCQNFVDDEFCQVKENIFPRGAYIEEYDTICKKQQEYHPKVLTGMLLSKIKNEIIYYQRPLKSQKGLVSVCEFAGFWHKGKDGKDYFIGPKVIPKSSPLFQVAKIYEIINNIKISSRTGENIEITKIQKHAIFQHLDNHEKLAYNDLLKILNLKKDECYGNKQLQKGLSGNITKHAIGKCFGDAIEYKYLIKFNLENKKDEQGDQARYCDKKTGEIFVKDAVCIREEVEQEPLYQLWHTIYSIQDVEVCSNTLQNRFGVEKSIANQLANIDFSRHGFGNKSAKVIRKILPYLIEGDSYDKAMGFAGYDHSNSLTKDENMQRLLDSKLRLLSKNSLRQPIVEKILNQMVNVVNAIIDKYGKPDQIRIELARELKQSKEERNKTEKAMNTRQRENEEISKCLAEYGLRATRNNIIKWRLYEEIDNKDKKLNAICIYCGQPISLSEAIRGNDVDVEHIIPKSKLFDDSQSNKTLAHRHCNKNKNDMTAYDFMKSKSDKILDEYVARVNRLYANKVINKTKRDKLLMTESKIPDDFIERQLRESQYIAKKACKMLKTICHDVFSTSGSITAELRHLWGWDDVTMKHQMPKYRELGLTEFVEWESDHGKNKHRKEIISGWTKRDDHRHHAVDALAIACTKQGYIQRFNTLNSTSTREEMASIVEKRSVEFNEKRSLLEKYIIVEQPFSAEDVENAVANILISFKAGKKVATVGKRKVGKRGNKTVVQTGIIVPRGALSEESVYGKIKSIEQGKKLNHIFENPNLIVKPKIKTLIAERLAKFEGDTKKAIASLKKDPIYLDEKKKIKVEYASCFKEEYVIKYPVDTNFKRTEKVVDGQVRKILQERLQKFDNKEKEAFKDVQKDGTILKWYEDEGLSRPIKSVRCFTGLSAVVPVKKDEKGRDIGFVKPGNNHHIAIYSDAVENRFAHGCTFWHAVERKKHGIPVIILSANDIWDKLQTKPEDTYPEIFLKALPPANSDLLLSFQQNEMFVLDMENKKDIEWLDINKDYCRISDNLFRVQKIAISGSSIDIVFRHHLETQLVDDINAQKSKRFIRVNSLRALFDLNPVKTKIDCLGNIKFIGENHDKTNTVFRKSSLFV